MRKFNVTIQYNHETLFCITYSDLNDDKEIFARLQELINCIPKGKVKEKEIPRIANSIVNAVCKRGGGLFGGTSNEFKKELNTFTSIFEQEFLCKAHASVSGVIAVTPEAIKVLEHEADLTAVLDLKYQMIDCSQCAYFSSDRYAFIRAFREVFHHHSYQDPYHAFFHELKKEQLPIIQESLGNLNFAYVSDLCELMERFNTNSYFTPAGAVLRFNDDFYDENLYYLEKEDEEEELMYDEEN